ncbi:hypothetical protein FACS1894163_02030 [Spirochaetia bacterium]|nr:hypothetical protein FACS1894163_02030 [Spirochaetia bacterium]
MKKFYCVQTEIYSTGLVKAAVVREKLAQQCPPFTVRHLVGLKVSQIWFGSKDEAESAVVEVRRE